MSLFSNKKHIKQQNVVLILWANQFTSSVVSLQTTNKIDNKKNYNLFYSSFVLFSDYFHRFKI